MKDGEHLPAALPSRRQRTEAVWRERAQRLSRRHNLTGTEQNAFPVLVLGIGKERYSIDLGDVAEVFPPVRPTPVPGAAAVFSGVINAHGEIRPVMDLRRLLGMETEIEAGRKDAFARVILLRKDGREMGLQADSVEQVRWIGSNDMQTAGDGEAGSPRHISAHIKGSTTDLLMLLSTEALFAELDGGATH